MGMDAFGLLSERQREVLTRRFGLDGRPAQTRDQVALEMEKSAEFVRRLELVALIRMAEVCRGERNPAAARLLENPDYQ